MSLESALLHLSLFQYSEQDPISDPDKRQRAAQAAEQRLKDQQMRGVTKDGGDAPLRKAHAELPENADSNLRWQMN